jgi:hypothetical protein
VTCSILNVSKSELFQISKHLFRKRSPNLIRVCDFYAYSRLREGQRTKYSLQELPGNVAWRTNAAVELATKSLLLMNLSYLYCVAAFEHCCMNTSRIDI